MTRIAMHKSIFAGIQRLERERRANVIARPMRNMLDILARGEVDGVLADRLRSRSTIEGWPTANAGLVERRGSQAREEFDATVKRIADTPDGRISQAITTTRIAWEFESCSELKRHELPATKSLASRMQGTRCAHLDERATNGEPHDRCNHPRGPIPMHDGCVWHTKVQTLRRAANSLPRA